MNKHYAFDKELGQIVEVKEQDIEKYHPTTNTMRRFREYQNLMVQLNYLYDDIMSGKFGEDAKTGKFVAHLNAIKLKYPKQINTDGEQ